MEKFRTSITLFRHLHKRPRCNFNRRAINRITQAMGLKFCANLSFMFLEGSTFLDRCVMAKNAGFKAVETGFPLNSTLEHVLQAQELSGLETVLINLKTDLPNGDLGVTAVPGKENVFRDNLNITVDYAKLLKASKIHIMAGKVLTVTEKNWEVYENNLKYAADVLKEKNIVGVIEPINQHSVPLYFLNDFEKAVEIIRRVNSPNLKLMLDVFHLQQIAGDLSFNIQKLMPYVGHVQIAQVPLRNEPDTAGEIDYQYILQHIQNCGYNGWVGLEYKPAASTEEGLKWIKNFGYSL